MTDLTSQLAGFSIAAHILKLIIEKNGQRGDTLVVMSGSRLKSRARTYQNVRNRRALKLKLIKTLSLSLFVPLSLGRNLHIFRHFSRQAKQRRTRRAKQSQTSAIPISRLNGFHSY